MLGAARILDLTWVLGGPFAGQLLAQLGAEVIKIEPPEGDLSRAVPPHFFEGDSSFFLSVNRGKRGVAIDLKHPQGISAFYDLVRKADAVIYGFAPDVPARLGLDYETLRSVNPRISVGQLIGLHDEGEYGRAPAYDVIVQAMGGVMSITGEPGRPPARVGYQIADLAGGLYLALGTCGALFKGAREGIGGHVQVSLFDCQLSLLTWQAQNFFVDGTVPGPMGTRSPMTTPSEAFRCADDRYMAVSPTGDHFWRDFCRVIGRPDLIEDERFATRPARSRNQVLLAELLAPVFAARPSQAWSEEFFTARVPAAPVMSVPEALGHPLAMLRSMVEQVPRPQSGNTVGMIGNPFKSSDQETLAYPPAVGAATRAVFSQVCDYLPEQIDALLAAGALFEGARKKQANPKGAQQ